MPKGYRKDGTKIIPPNRAGIPRDEETRLKISKKLKGHSVSLEMRKKISERQKGKPGFFTGKKHSKESRMKMSESQKGKYNGQATQFKKGTPKELHPRWKGGITPEHKRIRHSEEYILWRKSVFTRDDYTCIWCGAKNGNGKTIVLNADHIKPFSLFPELRFAIDNGRTLCKSCHQTTETYGRRKIYN